MRSEVGLAVWYSIVHRRYIVTDLATLVISFGGNRGDHGWGQHWWQFFRVVAVEERAMGFHLA